MSTMPVGGLTPRATDNAADLVVRSTEIHTGVPPLPQAEALAICDGVITAAGDDEDVADRIGPGSRVVDALGRRAVAGLNNDARLHAIRGGLNYGLELRRDGVATLRQGLAVLREQAARTPRGQWVRVVGGWPAEQFAEKRLLTVAELNTAAPDTPVSCTCTSPRSSTARPSRRWATTRTPPAPRADRSCGGTAGSRPTCCWRHRAP